MKLLKTIRHADVTGKPGLSSFTRHSTRAITLFGSQILLLYTRRYDDYSLPGGGVDPGETPENGLIRELREETGAQNIRNIKEFGKLEEYRPWYKEDYDMVHMISYCYTCTIDKELGTPQYESYEEKNGMRPVWIEIVEALAHNQKTLKLSEKKGLSLEREIFLLQEIQKQLMS